MNYLNQLTMFVATGNPDGVNEILNDSRYEGAMESISWATEFIDEISVIFISLTAFLIICVAIWRNVLAGAYAAFPKFWDQVHIAHDEVKDQGWVQRIQGISSSYQNWNMGTLKRMLMRVCPDIKVLTDFEDDTVEPKTYFTKAIAQMIAVVMIGIFIYNGYYRDVTVKVCEFSSEIFTRAIVGTDPIAIFDRVLNTAGMPEFSTDNALDTKGQRQNDIAKMLYKKLINKYTDITTASDKALIASAVESSVSSWDDIDEYIGQDKWKMSADCNLTTQPTTLASETWNADKTVVSFAASWPTTDFNLNTTKYTGETWYLTCVVSFTETNEKNKVREFNDVTMEVTAAVSDNSWLFTVSNDEGSLRVANTAALVDSAGNKYPIKLTDNGIVFTGNKPASGGTFTCSGIKYICETQENTIKTVKITTNGQAGVPTFSDSAASSTVTLGTQLEGKDDSEE